MKHKLLVLTVAVISSLLLCACNAEQAAQTAVDVVNSVATSESAEVLSVKNAYLPNFSSEVTVGKAFDNFLGSPMWQYFTSTDGQKVVQCTGNCTYNDKLVEAKIQFILNDDGTFNINALALNDIDQNALMVAAFVSKVYEEY